MKKIRVGIVGANIHTGWGARAHLPALQALPEYEVTAVATTRAETARETADKFGIPLSFGDPGALVSHPDVDLVAVCVRVPHHEALVSAAVEAGKHVYCEWPLTVTTDAARKLAAAASKRKLRTAVGLQARADPALRLVRKLLADGLIGDVHSVSLTFSSPWPIAVPASYALMQDAESGLSQLELSGGHCLDALCWLFGEFTHLSATMATHVGAARLVDTGQTIPRTSADQLVVQGQLTSGVTLSAHIQGAPGGGTGTRVEIQGTTGTLLLASPSREAVQSAGLSVAHFVKGRTTPIEVPREMVLAADAPGGVSANVANMYRAFGDALNSGAPFEADFDLAVRRHAMLDAIRHSAKDGTRVYFEPSL